MRFKQHAVMLIHHGSIGKDGSAAFLQAIGLMDVAEKMYPWTDCLHTREKFIGAVMDASSRSRIPYGGAWVISTSTPSGIIS